MLRFPTYGKSVTGPSDLEEVSDEQSALIYVFSIFVLVFYPLIKPSRPSARLRFSQARAVSALVDGVRYNTKICENNNCFHYGALHPRGKDFGTAGERYWPIYRVTSFSDNVNMTGKRSASLWSRCPP